MSKSSQFAQSKFDAPELALNVAHGGREAGEAPTLLMLHGATSRWQGWRNVLPVLAEHFHVVLPDLPGHGDSARNRNCYGVTQMADQIAALVQHLEGQQLHVLGFSYGGHVALDLAARRSHTIDRLVLQDTPLRAAKDRMTPRPASRAFEPMVAQLRNHGHSAQSLREDLLRADPSLGGNALKEQVERRLALDPDFLTDYLSGRLFDGYDPHAALSRLSVPCLMMRGDPKKDARISPDEGALAARLNPLVTDIQIEGAGHVVHADRPKAWWATLEKHLVG